MPITTIGVTGASWGLTAETALLVQSYSAPVNREKNEVRNHEGDTALVGYYNATRQHTVRGVVIGTTGVAAAAPGVALTLANKETGNGVTTGGVFTDTVNITRENTNFRSIEVNATQYPLISAS